MDVQKLLQLRDIHLLLLNLQGIVTHVMWLLQTKLGSTCGVVHFKCCAISPAPILLYIYNFGEIS